jgi:hypothetical protein
MPLQRKSILALGARSSPEHALVADASGRAVCVEALEQKLSRPARNAEQIAETAERDRTGPLGLLEERPAGPLVGVGSDRESVAETDDLSGSLEVLGELAIVDLEADRARIRNGALEAVDVGGAVAE